MSQSELTSDRASSLFAALSHGTRLTVFKAAMRAGPEGVSAGELAERAGVSPSNLSAHLTVMVDAGLLSMRRGGRHRFYSAVRPSVSELIEFLCYECAESVQEAAGVAAVKEQA